MATVFLGGLESVALIRKMAFPATLKAPTRQITTRIRAGFFDKKPTLTLGLARTGATTSPPRLANPPVPFTGQTLGRRGRREMSHTMNPLRKTRLARLDFWACLRIKEVGQRKAPHAGVHLLRLLLRLRMFYGARGRPYDGGVSGQQWGPWLKLQTS